MPLLPLLAILGVGAGMLTTVAGVGGSLFIVVGISALFSPELALAVTAPALLVGNAHRLFLFRSALRDPIALRDTLLFAGLAAPASFLGGLLATHVSPSWLHGFLVGVLMLGVLRELGFIRWNANRATLVPAAVGTGFITATAGGGSMIMGPTLLSTGMRAPSFVAACAAVSVSMHIARIPAYAMGGWFDGHVWIGSAVLSLALIVGNVSGKWLRRGLSERTSRRMTYGTLFTSAALSILTAV